MLKCTLIVVGACLLLGFGIIDTTKNVPDPTRGFIIIVGVALAVGVSIAGCMHVLSKERERRYSDD